MTYVFCEVHMKKSYYLYSESELKRKDNTLQIRPTEGNRRDIPIETVEDLYIMTEITLNTSLLNLLSQKEVMVHFFNYYDYYIGSFVPRKRSVSGALVTQQVHHFLDEDKRLVLAKEFVHGAADGMLRNLRYYNEREKDLVNTISDIKYLKGLVDKQTSIPELMGIEGNIHRKYYESWNSIINQDINFTKRVKRPPDNMINTLISFVNTLIYTTVLSEIYKTQLDPTISFLHKPGDRRFSLALDIAEIFKPLIGDRLIFSLLNKNMITEKDFTKGLNYLHLNKTGSQKILAEYDQTLKRTIKHKSLNKDVSYRYLMRLEAYKIINHILGETEYHSFKLWW